jgi:hypothetical protein
VTIWPRQSTTARTRCRIAYAAYGVGPAVDDVGDLVEVAGVLGPETRASARITPVTDVADARAREQAHGWLPAGAGSP